jgi:hypothetical protein
MFNMFIKHINMLATLPAPDLAVLIFIFIIGEIAAHKAGAHPVWLQVYVACACIVSGVIVMHLYGPK